MDKDNDGPVPALILNVPPVYPFILFAICIHCFWVNMLVICVVAPARRKAFTSEHMQKYVDEHKKIYPEDADGLDMLGNPDQGCGWYSKDLSV